MEEQVCTESAEYWTALGKGAVIVICYSNLTEIINLLESLSSLSHTTFLYQEETANEKKTLHFLKVSAPWDVLVYYAEELCLRAPLQVSKAFPLW